MTATPTFQQVRRESTASLITRQLREGIMYGHLAPGSQLSEAALASSFGVSRGPLREAMQRLVQEGLVLASPNRGLFVKELDQEEIRDLYSARTVLESAAGRLIIREQGPVPAVVALREAYDAMQTAAEAGDLTALSDADFHFHEVLVAGAGSPRLRRMHDTLMVETRMCLTALQDTYRDPEEQVQEHKDIAEAIAEGDESRMMSAIEEHMNEALTRLISGQSTPEPVSHPAPAP
ncbi:GntR family transcriptional regulator [Nesterenkonia flava]|uniref:GntR family transcriptional regulator n=1 Tax=Nesterenkonia flava TaxID=469799 RepID=A0ABU1FVU8_9MICC|nr:GntR family transcriptional regulator [Nesterenkonia flava]MDR5712357.1 GntR family transcriptional regulator [Nesterenkonia flava]